MAIRVRELFGMSDLGGFAGDRELYLRGVVPVFLRSWERTAQDIPARFKSVSEAELAVDFAKRALPQQLRPRKGALISYMKDAQ